MAMPEASALDPQALIALLSQLGPPASAVQPADERTLWGAILRLLQGQQRPIEQANVPLTGFLGPQRMASGRPATHLNMSANLGGLEWLIPQLTPNQSGADLATLLSEQALPPEQQDRIQRAAIDFALGYERQYPGTFPQYQSVPEATAAAQGASKNLFVRPLPTPGPQYPGR